MDNAISERISTVIKALSLKKVQFAQQIDVDQSYITKLTSGRGKPSDRLISSICREFNVNEDWLRNGTGEMFLRTPDTISRQLEREFGFDKFLQSVALEYLKLSEAKKQIVRDFVKDIASSAEQLEARDNTAQLLAELQRQNAQLQARVAALEEEEDSAYGGGIAAGKNVG